MLRTSSDEPFRKGVAALDTKAPHEALAFFQKALDLGREEDPLQIRMKHLSWFGLALTLAKGRSEEAVKLCEQAIKRNFLDPDLFCNLGIVYLRNGRRALAFEALKKGLRVQPGHARTLEELERYERRSLPVFPFLHRDNTLNILFGKMRHRLRLLVEREPAPEV
jgi:tetratricopeptide (TPR) repeat protein